MDVKELKQSIINNTLSDNLLVLTYSNSSFLCFQYCEEIAKVKSLNIVSLEDLSNFEQKSSFIFNEVEDDTLYVFEADELTKDFPDVSKEHNLIIICKKLDSESKKRYNTFIVQMPNIELWQVKDLAYSMADGCEESELDKLLGLCEGNIFRLYSELTKLEYFSPLERKVLLHEMLTDSSLSDLTMNKAFDFSNAVLKRDINTALNTYNNLDTFGIEPFGLLALLYTGFRNICIVQISDSPVYVPCELTEKQFFAIKKYSCGFYSNEELIKILSMLSSLDIKVKSGEFDTKYMIDYILTNIL